MLGSYDVTRGKFFFFRLVYRGDIEWRDVNVVVNNLKNADKAKRTIRFVDCVPSLSKVGMRWACQKKLQPLWGASGEIRVVGSMGWCAKRQEVNGVRCWCMNTLATSYTHAQMLSFTHTHARTRSHTHAHTRSFVSTHSHYRPQPVTHYLTPPPFVATIVCILE